MAAAWTRGPSTVRKYPNSACTLLSPVGSNEALPVLYGRVYEAGVTDAEGQGAGIIAQVVIGPDGTDPTFNFTDWSTHDMTFNADIDNDDEYQFTGSAPAVAGDYDWAVRYRFASAPGN